MLPYHASASHNSPCRRDAWLYGANRNVNKQSCEHRGDRQMNRASVMKFLNTSLLAIIRCLCLPPPSNQRCWLGADVIIINMWRQASDDWWEARPNQWWMPDKCLLWRLLQRHLRWSGCSPSLCHRHGAGKNLPDTLGLIFNQGLSGTWHYFKECAIWKASNSRSRIENKYMIIWKYFGCPWGRVFRAYETNFSVAQTLIRGICR